MASAMVSPCFNCPDRIIPTKENPKTCHGNCEKEAEYKQYCMKKRSYILGYKREENEVFSVWRGKKRIIRKNKQNQ